jgi:hypothetical protein
MGCKHEEAERARVALADMKIKAEQENEENGDEDEDEVGKELDEMEEVKKTDGDAKSTDKSVSAGVESVG